MHKLVLRLSTGLATATLLASSLATTAFAATITISGNGAGSNNSAVVTEVCAHGLVQKNKTNVTTVASVSASTGGNSANSNTLGAGSGDVSVESGAATASLGVSVAGGENTAGEVPSCCECLGDSTVSVSGNGEQSTNAAVLSQFNLGLIKQKNKTKVTTIASVKAKTGKNKANNNTIGVDGGSVNVVSGPSEAGVGVEVTGSTNNL